MSACYVCDTSKYMANKNQTKKQGISLFIPRYGTKCLIYEETMIQDSLRDLPSEGVRIKTTPQQVHRLEKHHKVLLGSLH